jgi:hypothetical protein
LKPALEKTKPCLTASACTFVLEYLTTWVYFPVGHGAHWWCFCMEVFFPAAIEVVSRGVLSESSGYHHYSFVLR